MIAKIQYGNNVRSMIMYNEKKVSEKLADRISHPGFFSENKQEYIGRFSDMVSSTRMEDFTFHTALSLPIGDELDNDKFNQLAADYMKGLGMEQQPYVVYRHYDRDHAHIHICSVMVREDGKRVNDYMQYLQSEKTCEKLEKAYGLTATNHQGNKNEILDNVRSEGFKESRAGVRGFVAKAGREIKDNIKVTNFSELKKAFFMFGIEAKTVDLSEYGKDTKGLVFKLTDNKTGEQLHPIKASEIYHDVRYNAWEKRFTRNVRRKEKDPSDKSHIITAIEAVLASGQSLSFEDFAKEMEKEGVPVFYDKNKRGLYGITFLDLQRSGFFWKGSELGKMYSINGLMRKGLNDGKGERVMVNPTKGKQPSISEFQNRAGGGSKRSQREVIKEALRSMVNDYKPELGKTSMVIEFVLTPELLNEYVVKMPGIKNTPGRNEIGEFVAYQKGRIEEIKANEQIARIFYSIYKPELKNLLSGCKGDNQLVIKHLIELDLPRKVLSNEGFQTLQAEGKGIENLNNDKAMAFAGFLLKNEINGLDNRFSSFYLENHFNEQLQKTYRGMKEENIDITFGQFLQEYLSDGLKETMLQSLQTEIRVWKEDRRETISRSFDKEFSKFLNSKQQLAGNLKVSAIVEDVIKGRLAGFSGSGQQLAAIEHIGGLNLQALQEEVKQSERYHKLELGQNKQLEGVVTRHVEKAKRKLVSEYLSEILGSWKKGFYADMKASGISRELAATQRLNPNTVNDYMRDRLTKQETDIIKSHVGNPASLISEANMNFIIKEKRNAPIYALYESLNKYRKEVYNLIKQRYVTQQGLSTQGFINKVFIPELLVRGYHENKGFVLEYEQIIRKYPQADKKFMDSVIQNNVTSFVDYVKSRAAELKANKGHSFSSSGLLGDILTEGFKPLINDSQKPVKGKKKKKRKKRP